MKVDIFEAKSGDISANITYYDQLTQRQKKILICSKFSPEEEARKWATQIYKKNQKAYIVFGLGLGYHIIELLKLIDEDVKVYVIEANLQLHSQLKIYISPLVFQHKQIELYITDDILDIKKVLDIGLKIQAQLVIHDVLLKILPDSKLKELLDNFQFRTNKLKGGMHLDLIRQNYDHYSGRNYPNISSWYNKISEKPIVIVAGGPSLDDNIANLKKIKDQVFIFAVGRVVKKLLSYEIRPNMFCMLDAQYEATMIQIEGIENEDIPMVFVNTANYKTVESYKGPKYIAYSMDSPKEQEGRVETGGSVATAILDLAIKFGGNPIIFVGQDLAYRNNQSHATDTGLNSKVDNTLVSSKVRGINGDYLITTRGMLSFKYFIESKIHQNPQIQFYNCAEGGAYIEGCEHLPFVQILNKIGVKIK